MLLCYLWKGMACLSGPDDLNIIYGVKKAGTTSMQHAGVH
jgi:hypothetical protein